MATNASQQQSRSVATPRFTAWLRVLALVLYVAGALWSLGALQASMAALWARDLLLAVAWLIPALGGWWITAGIGIRLGTSPRQFLAWLSKILGFKRTDRRVNSD